LKVRLELKRFFANIWFLMAFFFNVFLIVAFINLFVDIKSNDLWGMVPFLSIYSGCVYRNYLQDNVVSFIFLYSKDSIYTLRIMFVILSICLNLPLAIMVAKFTHQNAWMVYWFVFDILGFIFHCIYTVTSRLIGSSVGYLLMIPIGYPWVIFGMLATDQCYISFKLIWSFWVMLSIVGVYLYIFCLEMSSRPH